MQTFASVTVERGKEAKVYYCTLLCLWVSLSQRFFGFAFLALAILEQWRGLAVTDRGRSGRFNKVKDLSLAPGASNKLKRVVSHFSLQSNIAPCVDKRKWRDFYFFRLQGALDGW